MCYKPYNSVIFFFLKVRSLSKKFRKGFLKALPIYPNISHFLYSSGCPIDSDLPFSSVQRAFFLIFCSARSAGMNSLSLSSSSFFVYVGIFPGVRILGRQCLISPCCFTMSGASSAGCWHRFWEKSAIILIFFLNL